MAVLICAVLGMNVMAVLTIGILLTGVIGIADGTYDVYGWFGSMGTGITGMGELDHHHYDGRWYVRDNQGERGY